jgi:hypothetical protein
MKVRCSALGKIMTNPRTKTEVLSETAKNHIQEILLENVYGIKKEFWSKYTDKGLEMEDSAIQFAGEVLGWEFVVKNETRFTNEWITGEPDVNTDSLLADVKCSWDGNTFPHFDTELKNKDYFWQMQGYMWLTGKDESELVYCLMDTPALIVEDEVRRAHWKAGLIDESIDLRDAVQSQHTFLQIPDKNRVKRFIVKKDELLIEQMKERIEIAREYYSELLNQIK